MPRRRRSRSAGSRNQRNPAVAVDPAGNFIVVWESYGSPDGDPYFSIQGQRFDATVPGTPFAVGNELHVNTFTTGSQRFPSVAMDAGGDFVVVWASYGSSGDDGDSSSVQLQRYDTSSPTGPDALRLFAVNVAGRTVAFDNIEIMAPSIFEDGFEFGDTSAW